VAIYFAAEFTEVTYFVGELVEVLYSAMILIIFALRLLLPFPLECLSTQMIISTVTAIQLSLE
jgi:hypothetical protein